MCLTLEANTLLLTLVFHLCMLSRAKYAWSFYNQVIICWLDVDFRFYSAVLVN